MSFILIATVCITCGGSGEVAIGTEDDSYEIPVLEPEMCDNCAGSGWEPLEVDDLDEYDDEA